MAELSARCAHVERVFVELAADVHAGRPLAPETERPETTLGAIAEGSLDPRARRAGGVHYTPPELVARVVTVALDGARSLAERPPAVLDPAMGAGAFLCAALRALAERDPRGDSVETRRRIALEHLFGIDVDPAAVLAARRALWLSVRDASLPVDAFDAHLVEADALLDRALGDRAGCPWNRLFPAVFDRARPGFDVVLGNPPYVGGKRIRTVLGAAYHDALAALHPDASGNTDLAAHFLRRGFDALAPGGALGFVTTNTIAQGATRKGGLSRVVEEGGTIYAAERAVEWPGAAGVVTSLVFIAKERRSGPAVLDGVRVDAIDSFLSAHANSLEPRPLATMRRRAFIGCFLRGAGFIIDDGAGGTVAPEEIEPLLDRNPESRALVRPFMGGDEVMNHPEHRPHRRVIHFGAMTLDQARAHPALLDLVAARVKPFREAKRSTKADEVHRAAWWRFANHRPELTRAITGLDRIIAIPRVAGHLAAVFIDPAIVPSDQLVIVASPSAAVLAVLSSRVHAAWARRTCSTFGHGLRYTPSLAFETFPVPFDTFEELEESPSLRAAGEAFSRVRAEVLTGGGIGLSRLHQQARSEQARTADLARYIEAKWTLERAVFEAYRFADLDPRTARDDEIVRRLFVRAEAMPSSAARGGAPRSRADT